MSAVWRAYARLAQCSPETPGWSALLGGEQGPQDQDPSLRQRASASLLAQAIVGVSLTLFLALQARRQLPAAVSSFRLGEEGQMRWVAPTEKNAISEMQEVWLLESRVEGLIILSYFLPARYAVRPGRGYCF